MVGSGTASVVSVQAFNRPKVSTESAARAAAHDQHMRIPQSLIPGRKLEHIARERANLRRPLLDHSRPLALSRSSTRARSRGSMSPVATTMSRAPMHSSTFGDKAALRSHRGCRTSAPRSPFRAPIPRRAPDESAPTRQRRRRGLHDRAPGSRCPREIGFQPHGESDRGCGCA